MGGDFGRIQGGREEVLRDTLARCMHEFILEGDQVSIPLLIMAIFEKHQGMVGSGGWRDVRGRGEVMEVR